MTDGVTGLSDGVDWLIVGVVEMAVGVTRLSDRVDWLIVGVVEMAVGVAEMSIGVIFTTKDTKEFTKHTNRIATASVTS
jgi:hypothetical protein